MTNFINYVYGDVEASIVELPWLYATQTVNGSGNNLRFKNKSAYMEKPFEKREIEILYKWYSGSYITIENYNTCELQIITYGGKINTVPPTATASVARNSILKLQWLQYWTYEKDDAKNLSWVSELYNEMYGPNGPWNPQKGFAGCYINYPDCDLKNWEFLYWQQNYKRLQITKQQWDPNNIFNHAQSIQLPYDKNNTLFIGGYTNYISKYILTKDRKLVFQGQFSCLDNPSWLAYDSISNILFVTSEVNDYKNSNSGAIQSFKLDNLLNLISVNNVSSIGGSPCNIFINNNNKNLFISNYNNGIMSLIPYQSNGELKDASQIIVHNPTDLSHIHDTNIYKDIVNIVDLGLNTITQYSTNDNESINSEPFNIIQFPDGYGPRQIKIHPSGNFAVVVCQLSNTLTILPMDSYTGVITNTNFSNYFTISTLPKYQTNTEDMNAAELQFSQSEKYVYVSNRDISDPNKGRSSISVFKIIFDTSIKLEWLQTVSSEGEYPRYFTFLNDGNVIAIVNQIDGNFVSYLINKENGLILTDTLVSSDNNVLTSPSFILPL